ncbi:hypothetical protein C8J57DRAFT_1243466 [Mycena rebaudengoi]|nr:hypothetical protein C8J57DRAFT_1243466 [Mycena rebaudengoi]
MSSLVLLGASVAIYPGGAEVHIQCGVKLRGSHNNAAIAFRTPTEITSIKEVAVTEQEEAGPELIWLPDVVAIKSDLVTYIGTRNTGSHRAPVGCEVPPSVQGNT